MRCTTCRGLRVVTEKLPAFRDGQALLDGAGNVVKRLRDVPCPACHGSGVEDCCSGPVCDVVAGD